MFPPIPYIKPVLIGTGVGLCAAALLLALDIEPPLKVVAAIATLAAAITSEMNLRYRRQFINVADFGTRHREIMYVLDCYMQPVITGCVLMPLTLAGLAFEASGLPAVCLTALTTGTIVDMTLMTIRNRRLYSQFWLRGV